MSEKEGGLRRHVLVPEHVLLSEEEKREVLERYKAKPEQFPYISVNDPALRGMNVKPGDMIKIIRKSPTAGESVYYRFVVEGI